MPSVQFKISIPEELLMKLEAAQKKFKKRTPNIIASEVIGEYLHLWEEAERVRRKKVIKQYAKTLKHLDSSGAKPARKSRRSGSRTGSPRRSAR
jgi:hypothetical protein